MVEIEGTYKRLKTENYDEFLSKIGLNYMLRKAAALTTPIFTASKTPEGKWSFKTESMKRTSVLEFNLEEDWEETMPDGRVMICRATREGNKFTIVQKSPKGDTDPVTTIREFTEDGIIVTMKIKDVVAKQIFERKK